MSTLTTTKKTKQALAFATPGDAVKAIQNTQLTESRVQLISNSSDFQQLQRKLTEMPRPFGVVFVLPIG